MDLLPSRSGWAFGCSRGSVRLVGVVRQNRQTAVENASNGLLVVLRRSSASLRRQSPATVEFSLRFMRPGPRFRGRGRTLERIDAGGLYETQANSRAPLSSFSASFMKVRDASESFCSKTWSQFSGKFFYAILVRLSRTGCRERKRVQS